MVEILEIFIITYNRSIHLDSTLNQLVRCPFSNFSITILDNCSTDNTESIYLSYQHKFQRLNYIKNKINIGADANVLRAAELSNGTYTWILCDDDYYDFSNCDDILREIKKGEAAAIMVGWAESFSWPTGGIYDTPPNLIAKKFPYFSVPTFVPASIFKTKSFQDQIRISYTNVVNLFPLMTYYIDLFEKTEKIYVSKSKIVVAGGVAGYQYSFLKVMSATINTFYLIPHRNIRRRAFYDSYLTPPYFSIYKHSLMWQKYSGDFNFIIKWRYFNLLNCIGKVIFLCGYALAPIANRVKLPEKIILKMKESRM